MAAWIFRFYVGTRPGKGRGLPDDHLLSKCDQLVADSVAALSKILGVDGITVFGAHGYWKGEREETFVFEVVRNDVLASEGVAKASLALSDLWAQDSVLVTRTEGAYAIVVSTGGGSLA